MPLVVLKAFPFSRNGFRIEQAEVGPDPGIPAELVPGLLAAGYLGEENPRTGVEIPDGWQDLHHAKIIAIAKQLGADVTTKEAAVAAIDAHLAGGAVEPPAIPEGWRDLDPAAILALAMQLDPTAASHDEAVAAIEAHLQAGQA